MFGSNLKVAFLTRNSLQLYADGKQASKLTFNGKEVKDLEIVDSQKLETLISQLIEKSGVKKNELVLVLAENALFEKKLSSTEQEAQKAEVEKFLDEVPFDREELISTKYSLVGKTYVSATNGSLVNEISTIYNQKNLKVKYVVPITAFEIKVSGELLSDEFFKKITSKGKIIQTSNFLAKAEKSDEQGGLDEQASSLGKLRSNKFFMLALAIVFFTIPTILILYSFGIIKNPLVNQISEESTNVDKPAHEQENELKEKEELNSSQYLTKNALKVQVLNGSGIAGQASKVKEIVEGLGYLEVVTGNTDITGDTNTTINYAETVSPEFKDELESTLSITFNQVTGQKKRVNPDYDILITTGSEK